MSFIAPSGTPVSLADVALGMLTAWPRASAYKRFCSQVIEQARVGECWGFSSGRAAMTAALSALRRSSDPYRKYVVIPAYTCYSVPAAVSRAGLVPKLCDIDPLTLSMRTEQLAQIDLSRVLAIVTANLYGIPNELPQIEALARSAGVFLFDDAAQAMGAKVNGRTVGTFGDLGLFSFDKGKNVPTMQGAVLCSGNVHVARIIDAEWRELPPSRSVDTVANVLKLVAFALLLPPRPYGLVHRLPGLGLGQTRYETIYPITRYSPVLASVAARLLPHLDTFNDVRRANALKIIDALKSLPGIRNVDPPANAQPVYLRLPVRAANRTKRDELVRALNTAGIGATVSYPRALADVPEVRAVLDGPVECPVARDVADTIITLPTHSYCPPDIGARIRAILQPLLPGARGAAT